MSSIVTARLVPDADRVQHTSRLFGIDFPMRLEPTVYAMASMLAAQYQGGYWEFYTLSNGGFWMAPRGDTIYDVCCENGYEGKLSSSGLGFAATLYAYSNLSFGGDAFADLCGSNTTSSASTCLATQRYGRSCVQSTNFCNAVAAFGAGHGGSYRVGRKTAPGPKLGVARGSLRGSVPRVLAWQFWGGVGGKVWRCKPGKLETWKPANLPARSYRLPVQISRISGFQVLGCRSRCRRWAKTCKTANLRILGGVAGTSGQIRSVWRCKPAKLETWKAAMGTRQISRFPGFQNFRFSQSGRFSVSRASRA